MAAYRRADDERTRPRVARLHVAGELTLERLSGRRILVTGGRGFIGSHLRRRLLELGGHVFATTRSSVDGDGGWIRVDLSDLQTGRSAVGAGPSPRAGHLPGP